MGREIIKSSRVNEEYIRIKHKSGLSVCLYPMKGFNSSYALFGAKYGSVDTTFKTGDDSDYVTVPAGIAHYLEHKLFENEGAPAFDLFSKTGANANAFTSFDKTAYLFSCSQKFDENLEILLKFVQDPYFTDENVEKERGIIEQEIKMYNDSPDWQVLFNGLSALYHNNPVKIDIAGTIQSIAQINKELLYKCYNTFYNLNNMTLCIAGNIDVDKTLEICDKTLKFSEDKGLLSSHVHEPYEIREKEISVKMSCSIPLFTIMFKLFVKESESLENNIFYSILFEIIFGVSGDFYNTHYKSGLINDAFSAGVFNGRGFFAGVVQGESSTPEAVYEKVKETLCRAKEKGISEQSFLNIKKKVYGKQLMMFGSVEAVATAMLEAQFSERILYDTIEITARTTLNDINNALSKLDIENSVISMVKPVDS
ncbi:MAG: insulinase family protein [Oscillospiraceae bacterium]|nr:insulinase family protein [Oscillospiraceae bacterium]